MLFGKMKKYKCKYELFMSEKYENMKCANENEDYKC